MKGNQLALKIVAIGLLIVGIVGLFFMFRQSGVISRKCGLESCHGLDLSCGANIPDGCTEEYMLGDHCRQYASCEAINNQCQLVKQPAFDQCQSCVEDCINRYSDPVDLFRCEGECP